MIANQDMPPASRPPGKAERDLRQQSPRFTSVFPVRIWTFVLFVSLASQAVPAHASVSGLCDHAARRAAAETGVPFAVLWSITRTETGRSRGGKLQPWPWTVNMEGEGHWFDSEAAAYQFVSRNYQRGARSFDVGCFQINYKWHGASFRSVDHMFDPLENARYAAAFLLRLFRETGDWSAAAGAYHSRTPEFANRYRARFDRILSRHSTPDLPRPQETKAARKVAAASTTARQNSYPLLTHSSGNRANGSLVPLNGRNTRALFTLSRPAKGS